MAFPGDWTERAACKGQTEVFFPKPDDQATKLRAVAICKSCRVKPHCKDWVLNHRERGIWAGMGQRAVDAERRRLGIQLKSVDAFL